MKRRSFVKKATISSFATLIGAEIIFGSNILEGYLPLALQDPDPFKMFNKNKEMVEIYKDVSKNKHIEHLKVNPKDAVEFALFKKYGEIIKKNLGKPNYEAGVKNALQELGMSSSQQGTNVTDRNKGSDADDLSFLKRFAK